jgi:hypothetical protein
MKAFAVLISGLLLAAPAFAQTSAEFTSGSGSGTSTATAPADAPEQASTAPADETGERRICRKIENASGSRTNFRRLCMTAAQWRTFNRQR